MSSQDRPSDPLAQGQPRRSGRNLPAREERSLSGEAVHTNMDHPLQEDVQAGDPADGGDRGDHQDRSAPQPMNMDSTAFAPQPLVGQSALMRSEPFDEDVDTSLHSYLLENIKPYSGERGPGDPPLYMQLTDMFARLRPLDQPRFRLVMYHRCFTGPALSKLQGMCNGNW